LEAALGRIEACEETIPMEDAVSLITAFFNVGDELPDKSSGFFAIDTSTQVTGIIFRYLKREKDSTNRARILTDAMTKTTGLYLPIKQTALEEGKPEERQKEPRAFIIDEEDIEKLRSICLQKIKAALDDDLLVNNKELPYILYRWNEWESPEGPRMWVENLTKSEKGLLIFLTAFLHRSTSVGMDDRVSREHHYISLETIETFIPVEALTSRMRELRTEQYTGKERMAVDAFFEAIKRREDGLPDHAWP